MPADTALSLTMEATDFELMSRLATGDDLALNALMVRWRDRVASFLYRMTGNFETAADLSQETFVKLYQARHRYHPDGKFSSYLFAIASNLGRNHVRWQMRHPTVSLGDPAGGTPVLEDTADPGLTPEEEALRTELIRSVHEAFQTLPPDLREAMTLFIYEGMSYAEIASIVRCSIKAAETRIYRARQMLKKLKSILT